ncbi:hypothetical protein HOY80DRAFT_940812 [Tuber brumale]|nr:hypothetical protein HOY80DRAFT_940812 [Tuber brumale]
MKLTALPSLLRTVLVTTIFWCPAYHISRSAIPGSGMLPHITSNNGSPYGILPYLPPPPENTSKLLEYRII